MNGKISLGTILFAAGAAFTPLSAQTPNTSPLPAGETVIGGHLHAVGNEVWSDQTSLYFNWRGNASTTYFWNLGQGNGSPIVTLQSTGNVGIGTLNPLNKLHVNGSVRIDGVSGGVIGSGNGSRLYFSSGTVTAIEENWGLNLIGDDQNPVKIRNAALLVGYTSNTPGYGTQGNLLVQGDVGIGTMTTDARLTVKGVVHSQEVRVDMDFPGPDYVFDRKYKLRSLSEVEEYIHYHQHLPEVPSSLEMQANGLNLKEMNLLLLKKIEELTLYVIAQQKQIDSLQQTPNKQKKKRERHK